MNILFLDDDLDRFKQFQRNSGLTPHHVLTRSQFVGALAREPFDLIMLDHDLGEAQDRERWDGRAAAKILADNRFLVGDNCRVIIHSMNPPGVASMMAIMASADHLIVSVVPNAWTKIQWYYPSTGLCFGA